MKVLHSGCSAGCGGGDEERLRCHALAAAAGVPVMKWFRLWWWGWWWPGLPGQSAVGGMAMKYLRAHSSDKMAGRKSEGCQGKQKIINNQNYTVDKMTKWFLVAQSCKLKHNG